MHHLRLGVSAVRLLIMFCLTCSGVGVFRSGGGGTVDHLGGGGGGGGICKTVDEDDDFLLTVAVDDDVGHRRHVEERGASGWLDSARALFKLHQSGSPRGEGTLHERLDASPVRERGRHGRCGRHPDGEAAHRRPRSRAAASHTPVLVGRVRAAARSTRDRGHMIEDSPRCPVC